MFPLSNGYAQVHRHTQTHHGCPQAQGQGKINLGSPESPGVISGLVTHEVTSLCQIEENPMSSEPSVDLCLDPRWRKQPGAPV